MAAVGRRGPGGFPIAEDQAYFRAVEEVFLGLRGSPLTLSPSDGRIARAWYHAGIPLELVARVLEELFARRRERAAEEERDDDKVWSLRQCNPAVVAAWRSRARLAAPARSGGAPTALDVPARLAELAAALAEVAGTDELRRRIAALAGDAPTVEEALADLDDELLALAEAALDHRARGELESELARAVSRLARRLPRDEIAAARARLRRQLLRRRLGLPELSLFADPT